MKMTTRDIYYLSGVIETLPLKAKVMLGRLLDQVHEIEEAANNKEEIHPDSAYGQWMKRFNNE